MRNIILILFIFSFSNLIRCYWTNPIKLFEAAHTDGCSISSVYFDPMTKINHVMLVDGFPGTNYYFAVDLDGKILYSTVFQDIYGASKAIIRGSGNGKNLFLAIQGYRFIENSYVSDVNFTESKDGGLTWSTMITIPHKRGTEQYNRELGDMLIIEDTGRIFIFYQIRESEGIAMVSRTPGSTIFSQETIIYSDRKVRGIASVYTIRDKTVIINVYYGAENNYLKFVQSYNNGATWSYSQIIGYDYQENDLFGFTNLAISRNIYLTVSTSKDDRRYIYYTKDSGNTHRKSDSITEKDPYPYMNQIGYAVCGTKSSPKLITVAITYELVDENTYKRNPEYVWWHAESLVSTMRGNPLKDYNLFSVALSCTTDISHGKLNVPIFATTQKGGKTQLIYTREDAFFPE